MKKIFNLLLGSLSMLISFCTFAQAEFDYLSPVSTQAITAENEYFSSFIKTSAFYEKYPELELDISKIELMEVKENTLKLMAIPIIQNENVNYLIAVYNTSSNQYMLFFQKYIKTEEEVTSIVYSENNQEMYRTQINLADGKFQMELPKEAANKTCFADCMERQEENFESTFTGWIVWNFHPQVQVMAAVNCKGCCEKWWKNGGC